MSALIAVAVPLHTAVKYVAGAYVVFLAIVLFVPDGLVPGLGRVWSRLSGRGRE